MIVLSVILGIYTGILLSAFNARPLWNTSILGPLFLTSGLSAGAATILLFSKSEKERKLFAKIDILLIVIELFLITHLFMGFLASTSVQIDAANLFLGGPYTAPFWIFVVVLGMLIPAGLEIMELRHVKIPHVIPVVLVLFGSLMFRFIIVYAGQMSRWLY
jgi:formate-dependent nitrite reductase membrane component NrfD